MSYLVISFSHKNTDIQTREKLAFPNEENKDRFLKQLNSESVIKEAILLSTCNRVEIIISYLKYFIRNIIYNSKISTIFTIEL